MFLSWASLEAVTCCRRKKRGSVVAEGREERRRRGEEKRRRKEEGKRRGRTSRGAIVAGHEEALWAEAGSRVQGHSL